MRRNYFTIFIFLIFIAGSYSQDSQSWADKWMASAISSSIDPESKSVIKKAKAITENCPGNYNIQQVCAIFDYLFNNWNYMRDPGGKEYFEDADVCVKTLAGDCDDYTILMVSLLKALGGDGRIVCVSGHAFPEAYLGKQLSENDINEVLKSIRKYYQGNSKVYVNSISYHKDPDNTVWLNLDWQENQPGGFFFEQSPKADHLVIYSNGKYRRALLNSE